MLWRNSIVLTATIVSFIILSNPLLAQGNAWRRALSFQGGWRSEYFNAEYKASWHDIFGNYPWRIDCESKDTGRTSFGIGTLSRKPSGLAVKLGYQFRPESKIAYTMSGNEIDYPQDFVPTVDYQLHTVSLSIMKYLAIFKERLDVYLGGGPAFHLMRSGGANSYGFSVFPIAGLEFYLKRNIGMFVEYQYHMGGISGKQESYTVPEIQMSYEYENRLSLWGRAVWTGINLYFSN